MLIFFFSLLLFCFFHFLIFSSVILPNICPMISSNCSAVVWRHREKERISTSGLSDVIPTILSLSLSHRPHLNFDSRFNPHYFSLEVARVLLFVLFCSARLFFFHFSFRQWLADIELLVEGRRVYYLFLVANVFVCQARPIRPCFERPFLCPIRLMVHCGGRFQYIPSPARATTTTTSEPF